SLVDLSLLKSIQDGRFLMLETIREYAAARLNESGESAEHGQRHAKYFAAVAVGLDPWGRAHAEGDDEEARSVHFEREQDNLRVALEHVLRVGMVDRALAMVNALCEYWLFRGQLEEGERWTQRAVDAAPQAPSLALANAINGVGEFARFRGDSARAILLKEQALATYRSVDNSVYVAATLHDLADTWAHVGDYAR